MDVYVCMYAFVIQLNRSRCAEYLWNLIIIFMLIVPVVFIPVVFPVYFVPIVIPLDFTCCIVKYFPRLKLYTCFRDEDFLFSFVFCTDVFFYIALLRCGCNASLLESRRLYIYMLLCFLRTANIILEQSSTIFLEILRSCLRH